jgi:hypothetical protein
VGHALAEKCRFSRGRIPSSLYPLFDPPAIITLLVDGIEFGEGITIFECGFRFSERIPVAFVSLTMSSSGTEKVIQFAKRQQNSPAAFKKSFFKAFKMVKVSRRCPGAESRLENTQPELDVGLVGSTMFNGRWESSGCRSGDVGERLVR